MKIMTGGFKTESNAFVPLRNTMKNYDISFGDECVRKLLVKDVIEGHGHEAIGAIYMDAGPSYVIEKSVYDYFESSMIACVKAHIHEIDGMYLFLHGASEVEEIGSAEVNILSEIRKIVGPYFPIFVACDPHGNLCKEYVENTTMIRSFRESPHVDATATKKKVAEMLCEFLEDRQNIRPVYRKLPIVIGGEQSVSTDEPVKSINIYMDKLEEDDRIRSVSWHVGYLRHDTDIAGAGIVVVPQCGGDQQYAEEKADELYEYIWNKRHEFHYTGLTMEPEEAMKTALEFKGRPVFITDSGDNTGSGSAGWNTYILHQAIESGSNKRFLIANINDPVTYSKLNALADGDCTHIRLGMNYDHMSRPAELDVEILTRGNVYGCSLSDTNQIFGHSVLVRCKDYPIDINVADSRYGMVEAHQFVRCGIDWDLYDIIVVKQGYIFPELEEKGELSIMSLTDGFTLQDTRKIPFRRIMRPIYPMDEI